MKPKNKVLFLFKVITFNILYIKVGKSCYKNGILHFGIHNVVNVTVNCYLILIITLSVHWFFMENSKHT